MARRYKKKKYVKPRTKKDAQQDKQIKKLIRNTKPEHKFLESRVGGTAFTTAGAIVQGAAMNALAQGVDEGQRVGNKVKDVSMILRMVVNSTATSQGSARVIIFRWNDVTNPNVANILSAPSGVTDILSPINYNGVGAGQFRVLMDRTFLFGRENNSGVPYISPDDVHHKIIKTFKLSGTQQYSGTTAVSTMKGALWMLCIGSDTNRFYTYTMQYKYTDC